ncbi:1981_t:CDS:2 [Ambispora gerdemannii]|uniref:1981_t:CDS:1 n=1 Tax=Ambispora gerdemannii TaxID=144530 RepID=A0A9N8YMW0_9GLOM|nr:1981_t:CDS:2 [Ambispora gerdemannii]
MSKITRLVSLILVIWVATIAADIKILTPSKDYYVVKNSSSLVTWTVSGTVPDQISIKLADERATNPAFTGNLGIGNVATSTKQFNWTVAENLVEGDEYVIILVDPNDVSASPTPVATRSSPSSSSKSSSASSNNSSFGFATFLMVAITLAVSNIEEQLGDFLMTLYSMNHISLILVIWVATIAADIKILTPSKNYYVVKNSSSLITWTVSGTVPDQISIKLADERATNLEFIGNLGIGNIATATKQFNWTVADSVVEGDEYVIIFTDSNDVSTPDHHHQAVQSQVVHLQIIPRLVLQSS